MHILRKTVNIYIPNHLILFGYMYSLSLVYSIAPSNAPATQKPVENKPAASGKSAFTTSPPIPVVTAPLIVIQSPSTKLTSLLPSSTP